MLPCKVGELLDVIEGPKMHPTTGVGRVKGRCSKDGKVGKLVAPFFAVQDCTN